MIRFVVPTLVACQLSACAAPVPQADLASLDDTKLLYQMEWLNREANEAAFGASGREGYVHAVREEILRRHPDWDEPMVVAIRERRATVGMTNRQAVAAIGWPNNYPAILCGTDLRDPPRPDVPNPHATFDANVWSYGPTSRRLIVWMKDGYVWQIIDNDDTDAPAGAAEPVTTTPEP